MPGENKEENLSECGGVMHNGTIDSTYFYQTWSLHRFCRSKNALYMSLVIVAVLVKPKEFTCTFSDRNLSLSKSKTATIFLRNLFMSYPYSSFSSICQNHLLISQYFTQFDLSDLSVYWYESIYLQQHGSIHIFWNTCMHSHRDCSMLYSTVNSKEWISSAIPGVMQWSQWNCVSQKLTEVLPVKFFSPFSLSPGWECCNEVLLGSAKV